MVGCTFWLPPGNKIPVFPGGIDSRNVSSPPIWGRACADDTVDEGGNPAQRQALTLAFSQRERGRSCHSFVSKLWYKTFWQA